MSTRDILFSILFIYILYYIIYECFSVYEEIKNIRIGDIYEINNFPYENPKLLVIITKKTKFGVYYKPINIINNQEEIYLNYIAFLLISNNK